MKRQSDAANVEDIGSVLDIGRQTAILENRHMLECLKDKYWSI